MNSETIIQHTKDFFNKAKATTKKWWKASQKNKFSKWTIRLAGGFFLCLGLFVFSVYVGLWGKVPDNNDIKSIKQAVATGIYDTNGELIGKYYIYDRELALFNELPKHLLHALVATEDARFYEHDGVDSRSMFRVFFKSILLQDDSSGGGSTITMQLAKNLFGRENHGLFSMPVNKLKEAIVAKRIEEIYTKDEILTLYLNTVSFSDNTYGIESAAKKFYNSDVNELDLNESATLIGTLKANHSYNPRLFRERSQLRRDVVLTQMVKYGYITQNEADATMQKNIALSYRSFQYDEGTAPYFREYIRKELDTLLAHYKKPDGTPYDIYKDGLKIYTTLDYKMQEAAENAMATHMKAIQQQYEKAYGKYAPWRTSKAIFKDELKKLTRYQKLKKDGLSEKEIIAELEKLRPIHVFDGVKDTILEISTLDSIQYHLKQLNTGFLALDPTDGAIRAYIGGVNFKHFKYDHISQSKRQVGSTFKPFVYTTALENGIEPCTYYEIKPVTYNDNGKEWTPTNSSSNEEDTEFTTYNLKYALSHSVNTIAVKVVRDAGVDNTVRMAHKMGIKSDLPMVPSIALGTASLSLKELAGAYASFVNDSRPVQPYFITRIEDRFGNEIVSFEKPDKLPKVYSDNTRQTMVSFMEATVNEGTATRLRYKYKLNNQIAGKTGTTQDNRDAWFVGITPKLVTVTWVGNDNHRIGFNSTYVGQGANAALPMFGLFYQNLNKDKSFDKITKARFEYPSEEVTAMLECEERYEPTFLERLFGGSNPDHIQLSNQNTPETPNTNMEQTKEPEKKEKKGFFSFLKRKKKK